MTKPSQFKVNTDYETAKNWATVDIVVEELFDVIVDRSVANYTYKEIVNLDNVGDGWRSIIESSAYNYALVGTHFQVECKSGTSWNDQYPDVITCSVYKRNSQFILEVVYPNPAYPNSDYIYTGTSQQITAHIQAIIDPFVL